MTTAVDLPHADRLALLQCREMGWIHSRTAAASLRAKGLATYRGITAGTEEAHTLTPAGDQVADLVSDELDRDQVQLPTRLHPGVRFRTHLGDTVRTVDHIDWDAFPHGRRLALLVTVEPWPAAGSDDCRSRVIDVDAPILIHTPDDWTLSGQMELFA